MPYYGWKNYVLSRRRGYVDKLNIYWARDSAFGGVACTRGHSDRRFLVYVYRPGQSCFPSLRRQWIGSSLLQCGTMTCSSFHTVSYRPNTHLNHLYMSREHNTGVRECAVYSYRNCGSQSGTSSVTQADHSIGCGNYGRGNDAFPRPCGASSRHVPNCFHNVP